MNNITIIILSIVIVGGILIIPDILNTMNTNHKYKETVIELNNTHQERLYVAPPPYAVSNYAPEYTDRPYYIQPNLIRGGEWSNNPDEIADEENIHNLIEDL